MTEKTTRPKCIWRFSLGSSPMDAQRVDVAGNAENYFSLDSSHKEKPLLLPLHLPQNTLLIIFILNLSPKDRSIDQTPKGLNKEQALAHLRMPLTLNRLAKNSFFETAFVLTSFGEKASPSNSRKNHSFRPSTPKGSAFQAPELIAL